MRASGWIGWTVGAALLVGTGCEKVGQALDDLAPRPERRVRGPQPVYVDPVPATPREPPPVLEDPEILLDLGKWDAAPSAEREDAARGIDQRLTPFAFQRLQSFSAGGQKHEVAIFQHERTALEFVLIPAGTFEMGSPRSEDGRQGDETARRVTLTRPFLIARTEVTQEAWSAVVHKEPSRSKGARRPVENVNLADVPRFLYRAKLELPTEAQWEYACRAGTKTAYNFGDAASQLADHAWLETNAAGATHPVAEKKPNAFGLHDMHGNVWEWCSDRYSSRSAAPVVDPTGPEDVTDHVVKGGSWGNLPAVLRSAFRFRMHPGDKHGGVGVRPVKTIPIP